MFADLVLSSALRKRTRYIAMMSLGIAMMLVAVAGPISKDEAATTGAWAVGFLVLSVLLLGALGTERAFIRLLRNSDIPPDTVAAAILPWPSGA
jgi:predicted Na+-dependent transporter